MALAQGAFGGFAHDREHLGERVFKGAGLFVEIFDRAELFLPIGDAGAQLVVGFGFQRWLQIADQLDQRLQALEFAVILGAENFSADTV